MILPETLHLQWFSGIIQDSFATLHETLFSHDIKDDGIHGTRMHSNHKVRGYLERTRYEMVATVDKPVVTILHLQIFYGSWTSSSTQYCLNQVAVYAAPTNTRWNFWEIWGYISHSEPSPHRSTLALYETWRMRSFWVHAFKLDLLEIERSSRRDEKWLDRTVKRRKMAGQDGKRIPFLSESKARSKTGEKAKQARIQSPLVPR